MAARSPRRTFATPLVITLAACSSSKSPPQPPPEHTHNPPAPTADAAEPAPPPSGSAERRWNVRRSADTCWATEMIACPHGKAGEPMPTCNPPAPIKYACPDGLADQTALVVMQYSGSGDCVVVPDPVSCPPNAMCNPPRPRPVVCP